MEGKLAPSSLDNTDAPTKTSSMAGHVSSSIDPNVVAAEDAWDRLVKDEHDRAKGWVSVVSPTFTDPSSATSSVDPNVVAAEKAWDRFLETEDDRAEAESWITADMRYNPQGLDV